MFKWLLVLMTIMDSTIAWGYNLGLKGGSFLSIDESYAEWRKYDSYRNINTPGKEDWDWTAEWHTTVSFWEKLYWNTNFHMSMDSTQIRYGGLEYYMGLKIRPWLHAVKYHHSQHCFDKECGVWPVEDSYGVRIYWKGGK